MKKDNFLLLEAQALKEELIRIRRTLHSHPELGYTELMTSRLVSDYLLELGIEVITGVAKTGVIGIIKGALPGNTIALRADMDALPITEAYESEYQSQNEGIMHACGHDAHTAMMLGTAKLLTKHRERLKGTVKLIFQPAEEIVSGAKAMIEEGVLHNPSVDAMIALHVLPDIETGKIEVKEGVIFASADEFEVNILGKGGHGSSPHNTIDPIITGTQIVTAIQTIVSRKIDPAQPAVVSVCQFIAGTKSNIIPSTAYLSGTIRCQDKDVRNKIIEELDRILRGVCSMSGAEYQLNINEQVPIVYNDKSIVKDFAAKTLFILDENEIINMDKPRNYSEDFALYGQNVPSMLFLLGTKNVDKNCIYPLHNPNFTLDEDILPLGTALFTNYCLHREG